MKLTLHWFSTRLHAHAFIEVAMGHVTEILQLIGTKAGSMALVDQLEWPAVKK